MVTFVSQCEKNALAKTRRVLDAFANRIGNCTWQTVITEEGLDAVKRLLRKTASKNTAVSCHWIRSRSRSEFLWTVGNKSKFNEQGIVPVNYTSEELKRDDKEIMIDKLYANTQMQSLDQHLFAVGYVASSILGGLLSDEYKKHAYSAFVSGCFHDLGKLDPSFQEWIKKKIKTDENSDEIDRPEDGFHVEKIVKKRFFDDHPRHNEISYLLLALMFKDGSADGLLNRRQLEYIKHTVYWHHAKPFREENSSFKYESDIYRKLLKMLPKENFNEFYNQAAALLKGVNDLSNHYAEDLNLPIFKEKLDDDFEPERKGLPDYKLYDQTSSDDIEAIKRHVMENAHMAVIRSAIVSADRIISAQTSEELFHLISNKQLGVLAEECLREKSGLQEEIKSCLSEFDINFPQSARNLAQSRAARELSEVVGVAVLNGPAGCGKTKIALEWAYIKSAQKIIWVCPRVQVCQGIFADLTSQKYLPNSKIEIFTGEFKRIWRDGNEEETSVDDFFSGDIVITTIDQVVNSITTHTQLSALIDFMNAHVVFDEYHEFINLPAFNLLFSELISCKKMRGSLANTLLVSATPNYYFIEEFLGIHNDDIKGIQSFNNSTYKISFEVYGDDSGAPSPLVSKIQEGNVFVITNTAIDAQRGYINNMDRENAILFHSKFTKKDKQELFSKVYDCFKEDGNRQYDVLRSGPIVQASLNISCDKMLTEFTNAESWMQRLGRLDRFGKNKKINEYITVIGNSIDMGKGLSNTARFLNGDNIFQSAKAWYEFLKDNEVQEKEMSINEIYMLYSEFYRSKKYSVFLRDDLMKALKKSIRVINDNILDPIRVPRRKKVNDGKVGIKKQSLRGDSRFVQMALCHIARDGKYSFLDRYAFSEDAESGSDLTASIEEITGFGASDKNLVAYMKAKHHNIKDDAVKAYKDFQIIDSARSPDYPIYLSYTPKDLESIGGESAAHEYAVYYGVCDKQPIGSINKINLKR